MNDLISRQEVIDAILSVTGNSSVRELYEHVQEHGLSDMWSGGVNAAIDIIIALPSTQPEQRWIPCRERLPEEHIGFYLVTIRKMRITALNVIGYDDTVYDIDIARWDYDRRAPQRGYHWCKADKVIAWMPLPEPYQKGEQNEPEN